MVTPVDTACVQEFLSRQQTAAETPGFPDGTLLGEWRVVAYLARGGSAEVYRCRHEKSSRTAAAKVLIKHEPAAERRFRDEIAFLSENRLPQFPKVYGSGRAAGRAYVIVEELEPAELPEKEREIAAYLLEVCDCLAPLHRAGFVHRDVKPKNIMRRPGGGLVLIDFGLLKGIGEGARPRDGISLISDRIVGVGTPGYAAPEQFTGGQILPAADIHAIGRLADAAFSGKPPRKWMAIIRRATTSIPDYRFACVEALATAIRNRNRPCHAGRAAAGLFSALLCVAGGWLWWDRSGREAYEWAARCETVVEESVSREPVCTVADGTPPPGAPMRVYRDVRRPVKTVRVRLNRDRVRLQRPLYLQEGCEYRIIGPGSLDAELIPAGKAATVRLENCQVTNRSALPVTRAGIRYAFEGDAGLVFSGQDRPARFSPVRYEGFDGKLHTVRFRNDSAADPTDEFTE